MTDEPDLIDSQWYAAENEILYDEISGHELDLVQVRSGPGTWRWTG